MGEARVMEKRATLEIRDFNAVVEQEEVYAQVRAALSTPEAR